VAVAADLLCIGIAARDDQRRRRSDRLVNPALSGPSGSTRHGGLHSGLMMAQVTAAALTSRS
jgi:histidine ammonia-lyase